MLYNSNNPAGQDHRASSGSARGAGTGAGAGEGATANTTTKDIYPSNKAQSELVKRQHLDNTSSYMRQISHDSGNASDCLDSCMRSDFSAKSRGCSPSTNIIKQIDLSGAPSSRENSQRETTINKYVKPSQTATTTTSESQQCFAQKIPDPSHSSHTELDYQQQQQAQRSVHQGASQKRWATSSAQSFSDIPIVATSQGCCLAQQTVASWCSSQTQQISGQQDRSGGGDQPEEDDPCELEEEPEGPLDYKPILAKILNEKKLALISTPEVVTFLNSGKPGAPPPTAHTRTHL